MWILTNKEMREADTYTIEILGVASLALMERAGEALADAAQRMVSNGKIVCVCGGGNNGGDGFVCARLLKERGRDVSVLFCAKKMTDDCSTNKNRWEELGGATVSKLNGEVALLVDCLFGTGFKGVLDGEYKAIVEQMRVYKETGTKILSADIPSGVNGDNGLVDGLAVQADETLCIGNIKVGALLNDGKDYAGKVKVSDIGIQLPSDTYATLIEKPLVKTLLPKRNKNSHKGTFGRAAIVAGSMQYAGAAYLSTAACLRSGAGYTTLFVPNNLAQAFLLRLPEALLKGIGGTDELVFDKAQFQGLLRYDSIAYGMGLGCSKEVAQGAKYLLQEYTGRLVLDADGLNSLAEYEKENLETLFQNKKCDVVITPHVKEFSRLLNVTVEEILQDGMALSQAFAKKNGIALLLKSATSIITNGEKTFLNVVGNSGQAKGGSGDVLSGVLAGLCAQGLDCISSAVTGSFLCGSAADLARLQYGEHALKASDCIERLGEAFLRVGG